MRLVTFVILFVYIAITVYLASAGCAENTDTGYTINAIIASGMFSFLGTINLVTGIIMVCNVQKHFKSFYQEFKCSLWCATILLAFPLFLRGVYDYLMLTNEDFEKWADKHYVVANNSFVLLLTYLPIVT